MEESAIWCDEQGHICFGYYHKGELCMVKVRRAGAPKQGEQKAWQKWKGGLRTLWGLEQCDKKLSYLCICFGEYDRMALRQSRVVNAVSVPCGDKDLEWIDTCFDELESYDEIILWPDNDKSGQEVVSRIADRLGKSRVRVVKVDYKDPNEMLGILSKDDLESAEDAIYNAVATAEWYYSGDLKQLSEVHKTQQDFSGYLSGIGELDKVLGGFFFGHLTVHGGSHKSGKTMALIQTGCMAAEQGGKVCVWPGEDSADDFKYKTAVHLAGYGGTEMRTALSTGTEYAVVVDEYVNKIDCFLHDKIIFLDKRAGLTEQDLIENFTLAFRRYGCDTFIVDNLMKLVNAKDSANTNSRQAQIVDALCNFAKEYKVHVHLVVHTNKSGEFLEPPTINSISGTKDIANLADRVILWWRIPEAVKMDYGNNETLIIVAADRVFGAEAKFPVIYDRRVKRYGQTMDELMRDYSL
jgi:twinkle protein